MFYPVTLKFRPTHLLIEKTTYDRKLLHHCRRTDVHACTSVGGIGNINHMNEWMVAIVLLPDILFFSSQSLSHDNSLTLSNGFIQTFLSIFLFALQAVYKPEHFNISLFKGKCIDYFGSG